MPRTLSAYEAARVTGMRAAQDEHQRLGTSMHERVPVFDVIEDARIWLIFRPMRTLYGAYEPERSPADGRAGQNAPRHSSRAGLWSLSRHPPPS